ncbi:MAG: putative permease [Akkermansiaceae bacterium]
MRLQTGVVSFAVILQAILPVYFLVGVGFALRSLKVVTPEMEKGMLKLVIHCLYPCLILDKTLGNDLVRQMDVLAWGIGLGFGLVIAGMAVAYVMGRALGLQPGTGRRTFCVAVGTQNYGYIAIPLLGALFVVGGDERVYGVLFIHSLGVEIAIWVVGVMIMTGSALGNPKLLINGPTVSVVLGVVLSWTGAWQFFEASGGGVAGASLRQAMSWMGACAFPMGLILIGATMCGLVGKEKLSPKVATGSLLVRIAIMPVFFLAAAKWLPLIPELKQVLLVQASMPAAVSPIIVARHYGGSPGVAVQAVIATSIVALVTMPLWISWGIRFIFG